MQVTPRKAAWINAVEFGLYAARRLARKKQDDLAAPAREKSQELLRLGREADDAAIAVQDGYADRDGVRDDIIRLEQKVRQELANRTYNGHLEAPYTDIFPDGVDFYIRAPLDALVQRAELLISRLEAQLAPDDAMHTTHIPALRALLEEFNGAAKALAELQNREALAEDRLDTARGVWEKLMTDTHATLITRFDRKQADTFFRKTPRRSTAQESADGG